MPEITGYRPQSSARQPGQQTFRDFVGTDDAQRKTILAVFFGVQISEKRLLKTGIMDNGRASIHVIGRVISFAVLIRFCQMSAGASAFESASIDIPVTR